MLVLPTFQVGSGGVSQGSVGWAAPAQGNEARTETESYEGVRPRSAGGGGSADLSQTFIELCCVTDNHL